jgi:hypothetical protein
MQEDKHAMLNVLPYYMRGAALDWHGSVLPALVAELMILLDIWYRYLKNEFQTDLLKAREEMKKLQFSFERTLDLNLTDYLFRKVKLL